MEQSNRLLQAMLVLGPLALSQKNGNGSGVTSAAFDRHGTVEIIRNGMSQTILFDVVGGEAQNTLTQEVLDWIEDGNEIKPFDTAILVNEAWEKLRAQRNTKLAESDWTQMLDAPVDQAAWAIYRQALRDMTNDLDDPFAAVWPDHP